MRGTKRRIWVAGHRGMVGSAILRRLAREDVEILTVDRRDVDLREQQAVRQWVARTRPDVIVLAAAKVGGILANDTYPAEFLFDNLTIETNVIQAAHLANVERLVFLGSSCIYPKFAPQPIKEEALLTGPLEPTNEWYAIAKIAGIKIVSGVPAAIWPALYLGHALQPLWPERQFRPCDKPCLACLDPQIPCGEDRKGETEVTIWGTGTPLREFLYVDDLADAVVFLMDRYDRDDPINCGAGSEVSIGELAKIIGRVAGFEGTLVFDPTKPDGTPRKLMDSSRLAALGWRPKTSLEEGINEVYRWFARTQTRQTETL